MTELRDVRLRRALDEAPDAQLRPLPRTRDAVLAAAHASVAKRPPWWRRLWGGGSAGGARMPWNSALATVLIAGLVTVLWQGQDVPPAQPEAVTEAAKAAAGAQDAKVVPAPVPEKKETLGKAAAGADVRPGADVARAPQAVPAAPQEGPATQAQSQELRKRRDAPAASVQQEAAIQPVAPPAPQAAPAELAKQSAGVEGSAMAPAPPPPAARAAPAPPAPQAAPGSGIRGLAQAPAAQGGDFAAAGRWSSLRLEGSGKVVELSRSDAAALSPELDRLIRAPAGTILTAPVDLRVRLMDGSRVVGTLVLGGGQAGWAAGPEPAAIPGLAADPQLVQAVRSEVERLLAR